jgi:hypothetical protein
MCALESMGSVSLRIAIPFSRESLFSQPVTKERTCSMPRPITDCGSPKIPDTAKRTSPTSSPLNVYTALVCYSRWWWTITIFASGRQSLSRPWARQRNLQLCHGVCFLQVILDVTPQVPNIRTCHSLPKSLSRQWARRRNLQLCHGVCFLQVLLDVTPQVPNVRTCHSLPKFQRLLLLLKSSGLLYRNSFLSSGLVRLPPAKIAENACGHVSCLSPYIRTWELPPTTTCQLNRLNI